MSLARNLGRLFASTGLIDPSLGGAPAGVVLPFAGASAPTGWLLCYGQAVSRTTYAALFAALGTAYGTGDGSTTFNLPDLRGRVPAGQDNMGGSAASRLTTAGSGVDGATRGAAGGAETHTLSLTQMPSHTHTETQHAIVSQGFGGGNTIYAGSPTTVNTGSSGNGNAHNNTQPTLVLTYIIKT